MFARNLRNGVFLAALGISACGGEERGGQALLAGGDAGGEASTPPAMSCPDPNEAVDPTALIDDMEDQNATLLPIENRSGGWWTAGDATPAASMVPPSGDPATPELLPGGRCGSQYAMHVTGQGFADWGAMLGMSFAYDGTGTAFYDAGHREGIRFWARIGDTSTNVMRFALGDVHSEPQGGLCTVDGAVGSDCYDTFGANITDLETTWKRYEIPFVGLTQRDFGVSADGVDASQLFTVGFTFGPATVFDLWVDDISFY